MSEAFAKPRILLIDDDRKFCRLLQDYLLPYGFDVEAVHSGPEGLETARQQKHEAIILDGMLPGMDGFDVLRELRKTSSVPVLMLTARGEEVDRIAGLETGADDYLPKTFSTRELLARLRAVIRRAKLAPAGEDSVPADLVAGELRLNEGSHVVTLADEPVELTAIEFVLLRELMRARGRVKTRSQLLDAAADREFEVYDRSIDVHISSLRRKLGDDPKSPRYIHTVRGFGYQLTAP